MIQKSKNNQSIYPENITKGALAEDHEAYINPPSARGNNEGDMQSKIMLFGVAFFLVFTIALAFAFGLGSYLE
jgi:hypothetical protein